MKNFGFYLFVLGVLAMVLNLLNLVPRPLMWIYAWGESTAWILMIVISIAGALLYLFGKRKTD